MDLLSQVLDGLRKAIPGVEFKVDRHETQQYVIVKLDGRTLAYISGKRKLRIQGPGLERRILIANPLQVPFAIEFVTEYKEAATV